MKISAVGLLWFLLFAAILAGAAGCASDEPENNSTRPWNTPESWEGGMPIQNEQHE